MTVNNFCFTKWSSLTCRIPTLTDENEISHYPVSIITFLAFIIVPHSCMLIINRYLLVKRNIYDLSTRPHFHFRLNWSCWNKPEQIDEIWGLNWWPWRYFLGRSPRHIATWYFCILVIISCISCDTYHIFLGGHRITASHDISAFWLSSDAYQMHLFLRNSLITCHWYIQVIMWTELGCNVISFFGNPAGVCFIVCTFLMLSFQKILFGQIPNDHEGCLSVIPAIVSSARSFYSDDMPLQRGYLCFGPIFLFFVSAAPSTWCYEDVTTLF